jgi:hypothetical protein
VSNSSSRARFSFLPWVCGWALVTSGIFFAFARPGSSRLDEDEIYWVGSAYYFHIFVQGDWRNTDWHLLPARENPPLAKYVIGLGLAGSGHTVSSPDLLGTFYLLFEGIPGAWGQGTDLAKRKAVVDRMNPGYRDAFRRGANPQIDAILFVSARRTMIVCAAGLSFAVFLAGARTFNPLSGLLASGLLLLHPTVIYAYNHTGSDMVALLFSAIAAPAVLMFSRSLLADALPAWSEVLCKAVAAGGAIALACSAKMNSLVILLLAGSVVGLAVFTQCMRDPWRAGRSAANGAILLITALVCFALINPTVVTDPLGGMIATVREHHLTEKVQATFLRNHLDSLGEKFSSTGKLACFSWLGFTALCAVALIALRSKPAAVRFVALWFLVATVCVVLWIPFPQDRYVLPVVLPGCWLVGSVLASFFHTLSAKVIAARIER